VRFPLFPLAVAAAFLGAGTAALAQTQQGQPQQAGVTAAVRGNVEIASVSGAVGKLVTSGEPVYLGNAIKSGPNSGLQILLLDQTTFTVGPNSEITIDKFVYDPQSGTGKVSASVAKGVFRFVTGKVAQTNPSDMEVKLPVGTIGIRGTIAMGSVDDGKGNGNGASGNPSAQIVLVGPGKNLEGNNRAGGLNLNATGGNSQTINQPGFGSVFGQNGWGAPVFFTPEMMGALQNRLVSFTTQGQGGQQGQQGQQQGQGGKQTQNAGAGQTQGQGGQQGQQGQQQGQGGKQTQNAGAGQTQGKNNANTTGNLNTLNKNTQKILGNANNDQTRKNASSSTYEQLRGQTAGTYYYTGSGTLTGANPGSYTLQADVNFANRTFGGGNSKAVFNGSTYSGTVPLSSKSFLTPGGTATFEYLKQTNVTGASCAGTNCSTDIRITLQNVGGLLAKTANHTAAVRSFTPGAVIASGSGTATRKEGLSP
jgi:hypothetical protein